MRSKLKVFLFSVLFTTSAFCQIENLKWRKADSSYEQPIKQSPRDYSFEADNAGEFLTKSIGVTELMEKMVHVAETGSLE